MAVPLTVWSTGLCDCCDNCSSCCYGFWCCCCRSSDVSETFGENRCLPLCDIGIGVCLFIYGIPLCPPPAGLSLRVGIRHRYGIKGNICKDIVTSCFCMCCSWNQMYYELKNREEQASKTVKMQPLPVGFEPTAPPADGRVGPSSVILQSL